MSVSLGIHTENVSTKANSRRKKRILQDTSAKLNPNSRVVWCEKKALLNNVSIKSHGSDCYFHGLMHCGLIWVCPVCAARISEVRRKEIQIASQAGYEMLLVTLTLQHKREDRLIELIELLNEALRKTRAGRYWQEFKNRYGLVASVSSLEITYSQENGFHPHKHLLFFSDKPGIDVAKFKAELTDRWVKVLARMGGYGSEFYSVEVTKGEKASAEYVAKWGVIEEVTKSQVKTGREGHYSMWQLLDLAGQGDPWAIQAYKEYSKATEGKRWLFWSKGARELLGLDPELSDEEIVEGETVEKEDETIYVFTREEWGLILRYKARCEILEIAEKFRGDGVRDFIQRLQDG